MADAGEAVEVQRRGADAQKGRRLELQDVQSVLETEAGRRFVARLLWDTTAFMACPFVEGEAEMAFAQGRRSVGARVMGDVLEAAPGALPGMNLWIKERDNA